MIHSKFDTNRGQKFSMMQTSSALSTFNRNVGDYGGDNGYGELGFDSGEAA